MKQRLHKFFITITLTCCYIAFGAFKSFALLNPADIVVVGYNSDNAITNRNQFSLLVTAPIASGETIIIVDYAWDGSIATPAFVTSNTTAEGYITWTTTAPIVAGTVYTITQENSTISGLPGTVAATGWSSDAIASGGDNLFIIQGSITAPTRFIWGFANSSATNMSMGWLASGIPSATTSWLPSTLTNGVNAMLLTGTNHADNNVYVGPKVGLRSFVISEIVKASNWNRDEDVIQDLTIGGVNFPANPAFTLPLNDIKFSANYLNGKVQLSWVGALNTQYYEVERSQNGTQFTTLKNIEASTLQNSYSFIDEIISIQYYRIKIVNGNGSYAYSNILTVKPNSIGDISFYPNPAKDYLVVQISNADELAQIRILDTKGSLVKQLSTTSAITTISLTNMAIGTYILTVENKNSIVTKRFVKQ